MFRKKKAEEFEVLRILAKRTAGVRDGVLLVQYRVKWKDTATDKWSDDKYDEWLDEDKCDCKELIDAFNEMQSRMMEKADLLYEFDCNSDDIICSSSSVSPKKRKLKDMNTMKETARRTTSETGGGTKATNRLDGKLTNTNHPNRQGEKSMSASVLEEYKIKNSKRKKILSEVDQTRADSESVQAPLQPEDSPSAVMELTADQNLVTLITGRSKELSLHEPGGNPFEAEEAEKSFTPMSYKERQERMLLANPNSRISTPSDQPPNLSTPSTESRSSSGTNTSSSTEHPESDHDNPLTKRKIALDATSVGITNPPKTLKVHFGSLTAISATRSQPPKSAEEAILFNKPSLSILKGTKTTSQTNLAAHPENPPNQQISSLLRSDVEGIRDAEQRGVESPQLSSKVRIGLSPAGSTSNTKLPNSAREPILFKKPHLPTSKGTKCTSETNLATTPPYLPNQPITSVPPTAVGGIRDAEKQRERMSDEDIKERDSFFERLNQIVVRPSSTYTEEEHAIMKIVYDVINEGVPDRRNSQGHDSFGNLAENVQDSSKT